MARFVGAFGVPHTPVFAQLVSRQGAASETGQLFASVRAALEQAAPDVVVLISTDHLNSFFFDNLPLLAIGVCDEFQGPNDDPPDLPLQSVPSNPALARFLRRAGIADGFDLSLVQEFTLDHSFMVPLHFLTPAMNVPVVPVFIGAHVPPLPSAGRAFAFGRALRAAIDGFPGDARIAVVGTGSFSLEVTGPRIAPGQAFGVPDPGWAAQVTDWLRTGEIEALIEAATERRMLEAGNVGGELLDWLAMLGTTRTRIPQWLGAQPAFGHAYGVWEEVPA